MAASAASGGAAGGAGAGPAVTGILPAHATSVVFGLQQYIDKMIRAKESGPGAIPGMKILVLDKDTKGIVSMVYGMSDIVSKEVYHVVNLDAERKGMSHMKAVVYVRPTTENLKLLQSELADPKCMEYHLFFSNIVPPGYLQRLASSDKHFVVKQVHEYYADYYPVNHDFFTINLGSALIMKQPGESSLVGMSAAEAHFQRCVDGIASVLLSLKIKPVVRYQQASPLSFQLARAIDNLMVEQRAQFTFSIKDKPPVLLVLDRKEDPMTPLLSQWTYQAMIHECIGVWNNRVDLSKTKEGKKTPEVILSVLYDEFFAKHMHSSFGEFAEAVQGILKEYKELRSSHSKVASIEDMQKFVQNYPEIRRKSATVDKHVALMSELNRQLDARKMFEMSELEQTIACGDSQSEHFEGCKALVADPGVQAFDALRLVAIFAIRYEATAGRQIDELRAMLGHKGLGDADVALIDALLQYGGVSRRGGDLFGSRGGILSSWKKTFSQSIAGVQNVFTQHESLCKVEARKLMQGKLSKSEYPYSGKELKGKQTPGTAIVYVIGGATFEEAVQVAQINASLPRGQRVILGGSAVLNSKSFLAEVRKLAMHKGGAGGGSMSAGGSAGGSASMSGGSSGGRAAGRRKGPSSGAGGGLFGL